MTLFSVQLNRERDQFFAKVVEGTYYFLSLFRAWLGASGCVVPELALIYACNTLQGCKRENILIVIQQTLHIKSVTDSYIFLSQDRRIFSTIGLTAFNIKINAFSHIRFKTVEIAFVCNDPARNNVARGTIS